MSVIETGPVRGHMCAADIGGKGTLKLELVMTRKPGTKPAPNADMLDTIQARLAHAVRDLREAAQSGLAADQEAALKIADRLSQIVDEMPRKPPVKIAS